MTAPVFTLKSARLEGERYAIRGPATVRGLGHIPTDVVWEFRWYHGTWILASCCPAHAWGVW